MRHEYRNYFDADAATASTSAIEQGMREGRRLRAQYVRSLFGKVRHTDNNAA